MRNRRRNSFNDEALDINLTPLIDVVFVVLIMFIVIAPLLSIEGVDLADSGPHSSSVNSQRQKNLNIYIKKQNQIFWKNTRVSEEELKRLLIGEKQRNPNTVPSLFPDKDASFGTFQNVKNAVELAGFERANIILKPS